MALGQLHSAVKGNTHAAKEVADRVEGRTPLPVKFDDSKTTQITFQMVDLSETNG